MSPRSFPTTSGFTPGERVGVGKASRVILDGNESRSFLLLYVDHETAEVTISLSEAAVVGEGPVLRKSDGLFQIEKYLGAISAVTSTEGPNEKQKVTVSGAKGGTFTLTFEGKTTGNIKKAATKEEVEASLKVLATIGEGNVAVTGNAGGPWTVEFKGALKAKDVALMTADASKLEAEGAEVPAVAVETEVKGGVSLLVAEG